MYVLIMSSFQELWFTRLKQLLMSPLERLAQLVSLHILEKPGARLASVQREADLDPKLCRPEPVMACKAADGR